MDSFDAMKALFLNNLPKLTPQEQAELLKLLEKLEEEDSLESARRDFMGFVRYVWPDFIHGAHHKKMADAFERVLTGKLQRLMINMPPRHTKSEFTSHMLPANFLGRYPNKKIIIASHTAELAVGFGRKVRNLVGSKEYQKVFPNTGLRADSKAAGRWETDQRGEFFAIGVGGAIAGKGADLFVIDDPHSEQDAQQGEHNPEVYHKVYDWYTSGPRQRLQPGAAIIIVATRWSKIDLCGQLLKKSMNDPASDQWEVIELPALLPSGNPLWPQFWTKEELERTKTSLPIHKWNAQYQQAPTSEEGALIKKEWWQVWEKSSPPSVEAILVSWDTAHDRTQRSNYSACTTWGVFNKENAEGQKIPHLILLDAFRDKLEFPELKRVAKEHYEQWKPDVMVIEKRASGGPLLFELRAMGIPVSEFLPTRGNDKFARVNAVSDLFRSGVVWAPEKKWAEEVIQECADFPNGESDDYVDSTTQALLRFRQGGWIRSTLDEWDEKPRYQKRIKYY